MHIRKPLHDELPSVSQLRIAAIAAALLAVLLAITIVLPAERGTDPTGIGGVLGLTRMGQLKVALAEDDAPLDGRPSRMDETAVAVFPWHGAEIKMEMAKGFTATYSWTATGPLYHDTHGDIYADSEVYLSYSSEDSVTSDSGTITALYGGYHGWYWQNNTNKIITLTVTTEGEYLEIGEK